MIIWESKLFTHILIAQAYIGEVKAEKLSILLLETQRGNRIEFTMSVVDASNTPSSSTSDAAVDGYYIEGVVPFPLPVVKWQEQMGSLIHLQKALEHIGPIGDEITHVQHPDKLIWRFPLTRQA